MAGGTAAGLPGPGDVCGQRRAPQARDPLARRPGRRALVLDGGLATHLEALGQDIDHSLWSARLLVTDPGAAMIRRAHADYFRAGAEVAITASYQAHLDGFKELGLQPEDHARAVRRSVELAKEAAKEALPEGGGIVAGSVGSYGASLHNGAEYTGDFPGMDEAKLVAWHRPRVLALIDAGCDVLACETIPCLLEARALVTLLEEVRFPAWVTFSCRSPDQVCSGEPFEECVRAVAACAHVLGAGVNCTHPGHVGDLVALCRKCLPDDKHVVVYPNSGEEWCGQAHVWKEGTATADERFVELARSWVDRGADCVGGCCRTSPETMRLLAAAMDEASCQLPAGKPRSRSPRRQ